MTEGIQLTRMSVSRVGLADPAWAHSWSLGELELQWLWSTCVSSSLWDQWTRAHARSSHDVERGANGKPHRVGTLQAFGGVTRVVIPLATLNHMTQPKIKAVCCLVRGRNKGTGQRMWRLGAINSIYKLSPSYLIDVCVWYELETWLSGSSYVARDRVPHLPHPRQCHSDNPFWSVDIKHTECPDVCSSEFVCCFVWWLFCVLFCFFTSSKPLIIFETPVLCSIACFTVAFLATQRKITVFWKASGLPRDHIRQSHNLQPHVLGTARLQGCAVQIVTTTEIFILIKIQSNVQCNSSVTQATFQGLKATCGQWLP